MSNPSNSVKSTAPLKNVAALLNTIQKVKDRPAFLPGIAVFSGFSGYGKSVATTYAANHHRAAYLEVKEDWTKKQFAKNLLLELGARTIPSNTTDMMDEASALLMRGGRLLLIDDAQYCFSRGYGQQLRGLYDRCKCAIILIGEEMLPDAIAKIERLDNCILDWVQAQPVDMEDAAHLRALYCDKVTVCDDLLQAVVEAVSGGTRRVCINLYNIQEEALAQGWETVDLKTWGKRPLFTGAAPARRRAA